jgi:hypothetical protein
VGGKERKRGEEREEGKEVQEGLQGRGRDLVEGRKKGGQENNREDI